MVGEGDVNKFYVNGINNPLTAADLDSHLDRFNKAIRCNDITIVYGACYSGSFIDELSDDGRIIVTSTNISNFTRFDTVGELFSYHFFNHISAGKTIKEAFEDASTSYNSSLITPLLDDNADGKGTAIPLSYPGDGWLLAHSKYICKPGDARDVALTNGHS